MKTILLHVLLALAFSSKAQPGQMYFPPSEYYYTILDESGTAVTFKKNIRYRICIAEVWYHPDSIPTYPKPVNNEDGLLDSLLQHDLELFPAVKYGEQNDNHYVRINDCYLHLHHPPGIIKIAHKKDTLFLFQESHEAKELKFVPGYHYFPSWTSHYLSRLPELSGASFINIDQQHFVISKGDFDSLHSERRQNQYANRERIDNEIADNYLKDFATIEHQSESLEFMQNTAPYTGGHLESQLYPTSEDNVYMAMMEYNMHENNCTSYKDFFTRIDLNQNKVEQWFPRKNPQEFGSSTRFFKVDTFNQVIYLRMYYRLDTIQPLIECASSAAFKQTMYKSFNDGRDWLADEKYTKLFDAHEFYKYEFLDKNYAVGYKFQKIKHKKEKYQIDQGVYYLLKDGEIVDSLLTPTDVRFNTNYANYHFNIGLGDTAFLGSWGYNEYNYKASNPSHIYVVKKSSNWVFEVGTDGFKRSQFYSEKELKTEYQNFSIRGDTLLFKNGAKMLIRDPIIENPMGHGIFILEQGAHIYLMNTNTNCTYISFDSGASWLFYPKLLGNTGDILFMKIDANQTISFFNRKEFTKESYRFIPVH